MATFPYLSFFLFFVTLQYSSTVHLNCLHKPSRINMVLSLWYPAFLSVLLTSLHAFEHPSVPAIQNRATYPGGWALAPDNTASVCPSGTTKCGADKYASCCPSNQFCFGSYDSKYCCPTGTSISFPLRAVNMLSSRENICADKRLFQFDR